MTSYTVLAALATVLSAGTPSSAETMDSAPPPEPSAPATASLDWTRAAPGGSITIDAVPANTDLALAQEHIRRTAALLDAIRTIRPHVVWRRIRWTGGRMTVDLVAESATYANVATLALRRLFPGRSTAGTGIRQARRPALEGYGWNVRFLLAASAKPPPP